MVSSRYFLMTLAAVSAFAFGSCSSSSGSDESTFPTTHPFAFQLQNVDISVLAASVYQTVVIDYSADGSDAGRFTQADIATLKASGKTVLAYMSIGEAESYRWYWQAAWDTTAPAWLGKENPD